MSAELLFEIGTEEIPAGYIMPALDSLKKNMHSRLTELNLDFGEVNVCATPRRLTVRVNDLAAGQADRVEEAMGPPKKAAFDQEGKPTKAAEGFAKSKGASLDDIEIVSTPKGEYLMIRVEQKGKPTNELLDTLLPELVKNIPFPKSMRWGAGRLHFARPIQWLTALYDGKALGFEMEGAGQAGTESQGHRFMAPETFQVTNFEQYVDELRKRHVLVDTDERREAVIAEINRAAREAGGSILADDELVATVANLVEKPHAICGTFDKKFLDLPQEVLITSMREHQKYFAVVDGSGNLMPHFIAVNNTEVKDPALGAEGHQRVLRARLEDAMFFFRDDKNATLADRVEDLSGIVFQAKLGTMLEKTERIVKLTEMLAARLAPGQSEECGRAAKLCKADLLTAMVNEFPSLQGAMGRAYALLENETPAVATAIEEHYMPIRAGSPVPTGTAGGLISMADRIDTICGCFGIGQTPTGATDPFGLRRLALGFIHIIENKDHSLALGDLVDEALEQLAPTLTEDRGAARLAIIEFIKGRYVNDKIAKGVPAATVEAVTSVTFDDLVDCSRKIAALSAVAEQPSFPLLAGAFKRVMNIIKDHDQLQVQEDLLKEEAEKNLYAVYQEVASEAAPLIKGSQYQEAMEVILRMKEPVDRFFDDVMVMVDDAAIKNNRLSLLAAIADLFLRIGDFSKMYALGK